MSLQMLRPFLGLSLDESLTACINDVDSLRRGSNSATIGPFGVFDANEVQKSNLDPKMSFINGPEALMPDWTVQASPVADSNDSEVRENLPPQTAYHTWPEIMTLLDSAGTRGKGLTITLFMHRF